MSFIEIIFYVFASILLLTSLGVILFKNPVYSAISLILSFITSAALWLLLQAEFLAIVLIFGEIVPKMAAIRQSEKFAERVYSPMRIMISVLYPIAQGFYTATNLIMKLIPFRKEKIFDSEEELKILYLQDY